MTQKINAAEAVRLLDAGRAVAVDVREPDEYAVGHIPGAKLLPLGQVLSRAAEVLPDKNAAWLWRALWRCSRKFWCWMSRQRAWIRQDVGKCLI